MTLVRWTDPLRDFAQLQQQVNRVFADAYGRGDDGLLTAGTWMPPVDIYQNGDKEIVLAAELPDMRREDIELTVDGVTLTIRGEKKLPTEVTDEQYRRIERRYGTFSRSFTLPPTVDTTKVAADYRNGVLTVRMPLREEARPRQISVNVAA